MTVTWDLPLLQLFGACQNSRDPILVHTMSESFCTWTFRSSKRDKTWSHFPHKLEILRHTAAVCDQLQTLRQFRRRNTLHDEVISGCGPYTYWDHHSHGDEVRRHRGHTQSCCLVMPASKHAEIASICVTAPLPGQK